MKGQGQEQEQDKGKGRKMEEGRTPFSFIAGKFHSFWERTSFPLGRGHPFPVSVEEEKEGRG